MDASNNSRPPLPPRRSGSLGLLPQRNPFDIDGMKPRPVSARAFLNRGKSDRSLVTDASSTISEDDQSGKIMLPSPTSTFRRFRQSFTVSSVSSSLLPASSTAASSTTAFHRFRRSISSALASPTLPTPYSENMRLLEECMSTPESKQRLVNKLMPLSGDFLVRVRFMDAVHQFSEKPVEEAATKRLMGLKICSIFFPDDSSTTSGMFDMKPWVKPNTRRLVLNGEWLPHLLEARDQVLEGLSQDSDVMEVVFGLVEA